MELIKKEWLKIVTLLVGGSLLVIFYFNFQNNSVPPVPQIVQPEVFSATNSPQQPIVVIQPTSATASTQGLVSSGFSFLSPPANQVFAEDEQITTTWSFPSSNGTKSLNIWIVPDTCNKPCTASQLQVDHFSGIIDKAEDEGYLDSSGNIISIQLQEYIPNNGKYSFQLAEYSPLGLPPGQYRLMLQTASESSALRNLLSVSEPFQLTIPKDPKRMVIPTRGQKIGDFTVDSWNISMAPKYVASIQTIGTTTITGKFTYVEKFNDYWCLKPTTTDAPKIPHWPKDEVSKIEICFDAYDLGQMKFNISTNTLSAIRIANVLMDMPHEATEPYTANLLEILK